MLPYCKLPTVTCFHLICLRVSSFFSYIFLFQQFLCLLSWYTHRLVVELLLFKILLIHEWNVLWFSFILFFYNYRVLLRSCIASSYSFQKLFSSFSFVNTFLSVLFFHFLHCLISFHLVQLSVTINYDDDDDDFVENKATTYLNLSTMRGRKCLKQCCLIIKRNEKLCVTCHE